MTIRQKLLRTLTALGLVVAVNVAAAGFGGTPTAPTAAPKAAAYDAAHCQYRDNGPRSEQIGCMSTTHTWEFVQIWLYCSNAPTVAVRGNRIQDPGIWGQWAWSSATCPVGSVKVRWTYAWWAI